MNLPITNDWQTILQSELDKKYFKNLLIYLTKEYENSTCYPKKNQIFEAFNACAFANLKLVIIGQDPYHGKGQANGLCFSVNNQAVHPPSLKNIFKELKEDIGKEIPKSGDLISWSKQGILLLNATLTVRESEAGSHQKQGWEQFTDAVIQLISAKKEHVIFLLWGGFAKKKGKNIDKNKHYVLESGHPSPLSANRGFWFGNKHFSKSNTILKQLNLSEIKW